jgi:Rps23 Pro-64 3,4-dihydroxylase Tpa1-like proline 4-hydroxylase
MPGGHLNIHADFNRYTRYDMHRRVNVFIYMNPNWTESYGGHLELWSKDLLRCEQKVS